MKHLFLLVFLSFFTSCVEQVEPIDESAEPTKILNLKADQVSQTKANILLSLELKSGAYLEYGVTQNYGQITAKSKNRKDYLFKLKNLDANTTYYYRAIIVDKNLKKVISKRKSFRTLKKETPLPLTLQLVGIKALEIKETSAKVTWKTNILADGIVYFGESSNLGLSSAKISILKKDHVHELKNLKEDTTYYYQVSSKGKRSLKYKFKTLKKVMTPPNPVAPVIMGLNANTITSDSVRISWTADQKSSGQVEYGKSVNYGIFNTKEHKLLSGHHQIIRGLESDTTYYYRVIAINEFGKKTVSSMFSFKTLRKVSPPSAKLEISDLNAHSITESGVRISWTLNRAATGQIEYGESNQLGVFGAKEKRYFSKHHQKISNLKENTTYYFRVISISKNGEQTVSLMRSFKTLKSKESSDPNPVQNLSSGLVLFNFHIKKDSPNRVYFDSSMGLLGSSARGFKVTGKTVNGIRINRNDKKGHYLEVSRAFTFWDNNTIRYEGGGNLQDSSGKSLMAFDLQYIKNNISEPQALDNVYYISLQGNDRNSGLSPREAWRTFAKAAKSVGPGSTVWVKAGNYGNASTSFKNNGLIHKPIKIIGYKNKPGDLNGKRYYRYAKGKKIDYQQMPTLVGRGGTTSARGFTVSSNYIIFRNLQFTGYDRNINSQTNSTGIIIDNCISHTTSRAGHYTGNGFYLGGKTTGAKQCRIINSLSVNGEMTNYFVRGQHCLISDSLSYGDSKIRGATDYYFAVRGSYNILRNLKAHREEVNAHTGHGLTVKAERVPTRYNLVENSTTHNIFMGIEARHHEVEYNVFRNITCTKDSHLDKRNNGGIWITSGASYNVFDRIKVVDARRMIIFMATTEDPFAPTSGHHNIIKNSTFIDGPIGIWNAKDVNGQNRIEHDNKIINSLFYKVDYLYGQTSPSPGHGNEVINSIITKAKQRDYFLGGARKHGWRSRYSNFYDNAFSKPKGTGNISVDSKFVDAAHGNFKLLSSSPLIDAGTRTNYVTTDLEGITRPQGKSVDIGVFEYH